MSKFDDIKDEALDTIQDYRDEYSADDYEAVREYVNTHLIYDEDILAVAMHYYSVDDILTGEAKEWDEKFIQELVEELA